MTSLEKEAIKYSVIIAAYNVGTFIGETIRSVQRRQEDDYEIIVVNDGSNDNTYQEIDNSIVRHNVFVVTQKNMGLPEARNVGLRRARGRYLIFLDGDDRLDSTLFDQMALPMDQNPNVVVVYGNYRRIAENGKPLPGYLGALRRRPSGSVLRRMLRGNFIASPGMAMVRASTTREVGGFDRNLNMSEDWNFWCRVAPRGLFINLPELCLLEYRQRGSGMAGTLGIQFENYHRAVESTFSAPEIVAMLDPSERARLRRQQVAHIHSYMSCQRIRAGQIGAASEELIYAICISPSRCLEFVARSFITLAVGIQERAHSL